MKFSLALLVVSMLTTEPALAETYWPQGKEWASISAEEAGFDAAKLKAAVDYGLDQDSLGVLVLHHGKILAEAYAPPWARDRRREMASAAKSMVSIVAGMALDEGKFKSIDQPVSDFITVWKGTDKEKITLRHLLSMTSGLRFRGLRVRNVAGDQFAINAATPLDHPPGTVWEYNTPAYHLLFHVIGKAVGEPFEAYAQRKLVAPLGMENLVWLTSQGRGDAGEVTNYYSAECTTRDMGRFGLFMLHGGQWNGSQLVSTAYFKEATVSSQQLNPAYGFLFWLNARPGLNPAQTSAAGGRQARLVFPGSPADAIAAMGALSQNIMVVPSLDLVVVRQGESPKEARFAAELLKQVVQALK